MLKADLAGPGAVAGRLYPAFSAALLPIIAAAPRMANASLTKLSEHLTVREC